MIDYAFAELTVMFKKHHCNREHKNSKFNYFEPLCTKSGNKQTIDFMFSTGQ